MPLLHKWASVTIVTQFWWGMCDGPPCTGKILWTSIKRVCMAIINRNWYLELCRLALTLLIVPWFDSLKKKLCSWPDIKCLVGQHVWLWWVEDRLQPSLKLRPSQWFWNLRNLWKRKRRKRKERLTDEPQVLQVTWFSKEFLRVVHST